MLKKNILLVFLFLVIISCSTKRNSFKNRTYNKINTDLNILFNGNEALKEVKNSLEEKFIEDFTLPIRVEKVPIILKNDTLQIKDESTVKKDGLRGITGFMILDEDEKEKSLTGLEKVIYKANKSIAYHSMLIDGKEYNSSIYRADKMIGIVRFYRGQSIEAIEAFEYAKEIAKKITQKNEIDLWIAKTYMQLGNYKKAESIQLSLIKNGNKDIIKKALLDYIQLKLDQEKYNEVLGLLKREFFLEKNKNKKARLLFLTAQVEDILNLKKESLADYQKVRKFKPNYQIRLKAYTNYIFAKDTILPLEEIKLSKQLNRYLNNSIYFEFKDEIYYALALLKEKRSDTIIAKTYYNKSLKELDSDPDNKMRIYKNFAEKFYNQDKYRISKKYYDSVLIYARKEKKNPFKERLEKLTVLDTIYVSYTEKDSIASLIKMNETERTIYFEKYIEKLKKEEEDKSKKNKKQEQIEANNQEREIFDITNTKKNNWYFYNTKLVLTGKIEFFKKWMNRLPDGNWRRKNAKSNLNQNKIISQDSIAIENKKSTVEDKYRIEFYTNKIPKEEKEIAQIMKARDSIELKLGIAYYSLFKNSKKAIFYLKDLENKHPTDLEIEQKDYFNLYKIYKDQKQDEESDRYKNFILEKFPNSIYAAYVNNPAEFSSNQSNEASIIIYENAYSLYNEKKYLEALSLIDQNRVIYITQGIAPKFALLKAYILGGIKGKEDLIFELKKLQLMYESSDEAKKAKEIINSLKSIK